MTKKNLNVYLGNSLNSPYGVHTSGPVLANMNLLVLGQLIKQVNESDVETGILESCNYDLIKNSYILRLRQNLYFHNGRKANARDLEFSLLRGFYSSSKSFFHTFLGNIIGVQEIVNGEIFKSGEVEGIRIVDEFTLEVKINGHGSSLFHSLCAPYFSLVPIEEFENDYLTWKKISCWSW